MYSNILFCSVPFCSASLPGFCKILACPIVPLSWDNDGTSVPLSQKVALSSSVENATSELIEVYVFPEVAEFEEEGLVTPKG